MNDQQMLDIFSGILRDLLGEDSIVLRMDTRRADVRGWDSFNYVNFIVGVEMRLGVKFGVADIESFENVGEIVRRTQVLLGHRSPPSSASSRA
ncbi:MAG: acyl carrier protein [Steroidobacteraceae bacterium]